MTGEQSKPVEVIPTDLGVIRQAFMRAADHIEGHPEEFDFHNIDVPIQCGTPACALGWVTYFAGLNTDDFDELFRLWPGRDAVHFYESMDELVGEHPKEEDEKKTFWGPWTSNPAMCAHGMRLYAERYCL